MKRYRKLSLVLCVILIATGMLAGCGKEQGNETNQESNASTVAEQSTQNNQEASSETGNRFSKKIKFTATNISITEDGNYMNDDLFKKYAEMFNFEYELTPINWDNWAERDRIWINSGDMTDMVFWNFNYNDYVNYSKQGLIKDLPEDYAQKYPNMAKAIKRSVVGEYLQNKDPNGKLYMIPNVIYFTPPTDNTEVIFDPKVVYYRADWAKKVGINVGDTVTIEQLAELAKAFIDKDPGSNGAGKTIGITGLPYQINHAFVQTYNSYYSAFHKVDGKYIWGGLEKSTLEGVKNLSKYFQTGIIDRDYFTNKAKEHYEKFDSGLAGIFIDGAAAQNVNERHQAFEKANPDLKAQDAISICTMIGPDGKFHGQQNIVNFWSANIFNPKIDDEKLDRILSIIDYNCTPEGQRLVFCGIEGKDYTMQGDKITITRPKDENGNFKYIADIYPSYNFFFCKGILADDWSSRDPSLPDYVRDNAVKMFRTKEKLSAVVNKPDYDLLYFSGPNKDKFSIKVDDAITEMILSKKDVDTAWNEWQKSVEGKVNVVLDEINSALAK